MASAPDTPGRCSYSALAATSVNIEMPESNNNGAVIDSRQIGWSLVSVGAPTNIVFSGRAYGFTGLEPGTTYYFRARARNVYGWSGWSSPLTVTMYSPPNAPGGVSFSDITQTSVVTRFTDSPITGGAPVLERQVGYSDVRGTPPTKTFTYSGPTKVSNLTPGIVHYFRSRTRNKWGWSPWSGPTAFGSIAGAYVKVGGVWKKAVPYVKVGGVWRVARPWGRLYGFWEESS
jgi:hypothetical protein